FLVREVLSRLAPGVKEFLVSTAVPDVVTAELADALTGRVDSGSVLDQLVHDNVFTYQQDDSSQVYRYHPLLRSYLLAELHGSGRRAAHHLHARAAAWFAS